MSAPDGFRRVASELTGMLLMPVDWLDQTVMYWREGWDAPKAFKLGECGPAFNVEGLWFRDSAAPEAEQDHHDLLRHQLLALRNSPPFPMFEDSRPADVRQQEDDALWRALQWATMPDRGYCSQCPSPTVLGSSIASGLFTRSP